MTNSSENLFADALKNKAEVATPETEAAKKEPIAEASPAVPEKEETPVPQVSELDMLKDRARLMGITFSNNIGIDALKSRIEAKLAGEKETSSEPEEKEPPVVKTQKKKSLRAQQYEEQMRLVRLRITNMDPKKKDLPGEIFTFANRILGTVRKYVPYGEASEHGYHVPYCIYEQLKAREFLQIRTVKDSKGREIQETKQVREFALEVLPPLTAKELAQLAAQQAAAQGMD